jgi:hypothetical protein
MNDKIKSPRPKSENKTGLDESVENLPDEATRRQLQLGIIHLFGTIDFDPACDYKAERGPKRRRP